MNSRLLSATVVPRRTSSVMVALGKNDSNLSSTRAPAVTLALAFAAGICASRVWPNQFWWWWAGAVMSWAAWQVLMLRRWRRIATVCLLGGWCALAAAWQDWCWSQISPRDISRLATDEGVPVRLLARVLEPAWIVATAEDSSAPFWEPPERTLTTLECRQLRSEGPDDVVCGKVRLSLTGHFPELSTGDVVTVIGTLRRPAAPLNPGDFDYRGWLNAQGVHALLYADAAEAIETQQRELSLSTVWSDIRQSLRQQARELFLSTLSPETAGVAETLLLGGRRRLDDELRQAFVKSGMLHVLAISGVNVALLGLWLTILARMAGLSTRRCLAISLVGLMLYAAVTDGDPPVVRATVMAVLGGVALWSGRRTPAIQIVALTLLGMMIVQPTDLFDAGAQLSFLSVLTISRTLSAWHRRRSEDRSADLPADLPSHMPAWLTAGGKLWRECMLVSFGIWLVTTPLVAWRFQLISPIGLVLNVLLGPLIVILMWAGYSFLLVGLVAPAIVAPFAALFDACLLGLIRSVSWASSLDWGHFDLASPPGWWMAGYYAGIGFLLLFGSGFWQQRIAVRGLLCWTVIGLAAGLVPKSATEFSCRFLALGHGLSVLMELPNGKTVLYDAGSMGEPRRAADIVSRELRRRGLRRIDAVILSHADADHCNALPELLRRIPIGSVLIGPGFLEDDQPLPQQIVDQCAEQRVSVGLLAAGHQLMLHPEVSLRILHPSEEHFSEQDNPLSLVTAVEYRGRRILLTGDVEGTGLSALLQQPPWPCDVMLSPHHGSRAANPRELVAWARPQQVVISTQDASSEDRLAETYGLAVNLLATARRGAIEFRIDDQGELYVETFRGDGGRDAIDYAQ